MHRLALSLCFVFILTFSIIPQEVFSYPYIPPTRAYAHIKTSNGTLEAKSYVGTVELKGVGGITVTSSGNASQQIFISGNGTGGGGNGTITSGANLGTHGVGIYDSVLGSVLQFLRLVSANSNCAFTTNATNAILNCSSPGDTNTAQGINIGLGTGYVYAGNANATQLKFKTLKAGNNISIQNGTDTITINATSSTDTNTAQGLNIGNGTAAIYAGNNNATQLKFKTLVAGSGISLTNGTSTVTIGTSGLLTTAITSIDGNTTPAQTFSGQSGNITVTDLGANHVIGLGTQPVIVNGSAQTVTKQLTLNSLKLGGNANGNSKNFTSLNQVNATRFYQNGNQVIDTLTAGTGVTITGSGNSRTISSSGGSSTSTGVTIESFRIIQKSVPSAYQVYYPAGINPYATPVIQTIAPASKDNIRAMPFIVPYSNQTFDQMAIYINSGASGCIMQLGVYNANATYYPTTLKFRSGNMSCATSGFKTYTITGTANQTFAQGLYWVVSDFGVSAPTPNTISGTTIECINGYASGLMDTCNTGFLNPKILGNLPNTYPDFSSFLTAGNTNVMVALRRSG